MWEHRERLDLRSQEVAIRIISKLDFIYPSVFDHAIIRQVIEEILYDYDVKDKETALAIVDNMGEMILSSFWVVEQFSVR